MVGKGNIELTDPRKLDVHPPFWGFTYLTSSFDLYGYSGDRSHVPSSTKTQPQIGKPSPTSVQTNHAIFESDTQREPVLGCLVVRPGLLDLGFKDPQASIDRSSHSVQGLLAGFLARTYPIDLNDKFCIAVI